MTGPGPAGTGRCGQLTPRCACARRCCCRCTRLKTRGPRRRPPPCPQAQLRAQLLAQLQAKGLDALRGGGADAGGLIPAARCGAPHGAAHAAPPGAKLWTAAMDALVADHLSACGHACALSVFAAEAGLPDGGPAALGRDDLLALLQLDSRHPAARDALARLQDTREGECAGWSALPPLAEPASQANTYFCLPTSLFA